MTILYILIGVVGVVLVLVYLVTYKKDSRNVDTRISNVQSKTSTDMNRFAARKETKAATARANLDTALSQEVSAIHSLDVTQERLNRGEREEIAKHQNLLLVTDEANKHKLSPKSYEALKVQEGLAQVRLLEAEGIKNLDWEFLEKEHNLKLRGALILAIKEHREMEGLTEMFELLVRRRHQIETGDDAEPVKQRLLQRYDSNLQILDGVINAKGNRLLKEMDGEES